MPSPTSRKRASNVARAIVRTLAFWALWLAAPTLPAASAQPALRALDAVWLAPRLLPAADKLTLAASAGYGALGRVAGTDGIHHRTSGALAVGLASRLGLALELRLDGRWDEHDVAGGDDGLVGEPRLFLRYGHALGPTRAGIELGVWTPGSSAPSLDFAATSVDLLAVLDASVAPRLGLIAALGPRFDRSAHSVRPNATLSRSDTIALGVSSFDALLLRLATEASLGSLLLGAELSGDLLLGAAAPPARESPWRASVTLHQPLGRERRLEWYAAASCLLSARPAFRADRHVPYEPRAAAFVGLRYTLARRVKESVKTPAAHASATAPEPARLGTLAVQVVEATGEPLPDVQVALGALRVQRTNAGGSVRFAELGEAQLSVEVSAPGFVTQTQAVHIEPGVIATLRVVLSAAREQGVLRVQVRDMRSGAPLAARCQLAAEGAARSAAQRFQTDEQGRYEQTLAEGRYRVKVSAPGYRAQTRVLELREGSVTLFNVDLTPERP